MAIRGDSYGSAAEVLAYTRHLMDGQSTFNSTTRPTLTELEKFIDRASGVLNMAFRKHGFTPANVYANSTAKLSADDWVVTRGAQMVELTQRGTGFSAEEGSRIAGLASLIADADEYVEALALGLKQAGITVTDPIHQGLTFTALDDHDERADPDVSGREQPLFRRRQFDTGATETGGDNTSA